MAVRWGGDPRFSGGTTSEEQTRAAPYEIRTSDGVVGELASSGVVAERAANYELWKKVVAQKRPLGHETVVTRATPLNWTPLTKKLSACTVALVSTGGVHLKSQEPFDVYAEVGDWTSRRIPGDIDTKDLMFTHTHYATDDALKDPNVMFPLDRLRELATDGVIGRVSPVHFGTMGFIPDPAILVNETVPAMARELKDGGVDVVVLTPG